MRRQQFHWILFSLLTLVMGGCAYGISKQHRKVALKGLTPHMILRDFDTYRGRLVLMGGEIIETRNLEDVTVIEVLQKPLGPGTDRPSDNTQTDGRFFVRYKAFKDPYVFKQGKEITVAGMVAGKEESKIGQRAYTYIVLENKETHLWPERNNYYDPYRYGYPYYPYGYPYYPWWYDPYYHPHRRHRP